MRASGCSCAPPASGPKKPPTTKTPRKPPDERTPECREALALVEQICSTIEDDVSDSAKERNPEYFEDVEEKAKGIGLTVETAQHATPNQIRALENILEGVEKWVR